VGVLVSSSCGDIFTNICYVGEVEPVLHVGRLGESALFVYLKEGAKKEVRAPE
jgi:hypothetical protein